MDKVRMEQHTLIQYIIMKESILHFFFKYVSFKRPVFYINSMHMYLHLYSLSGIL